jgi:hypothetical protein
MDAHMLLALIAARLMRGAKRAHRRSEAGERGQEAGDAARR